MGRLGPRLVVAGVASGVGKTTVATGLMATLAARGLKVAAAKAGPDFIDPGYHALATGRPGRNLDRWICGPEAMGPLAGRASAGADLLIVEGVMGLFDGAFEPPDASTAALAQDLEAPVVLVVDASGMGASVAAVVEGYDRTLLRNYGRPLAGVILNRVAGAGHEAILRAALGDVQTVMGALPRDPALGWRERHLGLVPVAEDPVGVRRSLDRLAAVVTRHCDLEALLAVAGSAPPREVGEPVRPRLVAADRPVRLALAGGPAFTFAYPDNGEALAGAGAELVGFDPLSDPELPAETAGVIIGGGFPEVYGPALAANRPLLAQIRHLARAGLPIWAECGGLLWLCRTLETRRGSPLPAPGEPGPGSDRGATFTAGCTTDRGTSQPGEAGGPPFQRFELAGVLPVTARMTDRLTLGYRRGQMAVDTPLGPGGTQWRGHEFHYSIVDPPGTALAWVGRTASGIGGFAIPSMLASYVHLHLGADVGPAERLVAAALAWDTKNNQPG
ncbi:MAG: cobyrinate a,c-diamide synthase [Acidimicrobiales bacterium]